MPDTRITVDQVEIYGETMRVELTGRASALPKLGLEIVVIGNLDVSGVAAGREAADHRGLGTNKGTAAWRSDGAISAGSRPPNGELGPIKPGV